MIVVIDNYDSFTYNIVEYLKILGNDVQVYRNDSIKIPELEKIDFSHIILSPGASNPDNAGIMIPVIRKFYKIKPILGICLGFQAIAEVFGGKIIKSDNPMHGKNSKIYFNNNEELFRGMKQGFSATRYNSLIVDKKTIKEPIIEIARTDDNSSMGIKINGYNTYGVQYHPEAILTEYGLELFKNFLSITK